MLIVAYGDGAADYQASKDIVHDGHRPFDGPPSWNSNGLDWVVIKGTDAQVDYLKKQAELMAFSNVLGTYWK